MKPLLSIVVIFAMLLAIPACSEKRTPPPAQEKETVTYPSWVDQAVIYEVNIRQYTPEGTFAAFQAHLPRLKELGVDVLWLMPIHPIGEVNRKGSLGSYYAVKDYKRINPEFGTQEDFRALVEAIHAQGMHVIIDWVANHTSWDNTLMYNPEYYSTDDRGNVISPVADWSDVADLNFDNYEMRQYMMDVMSFWVSEYDIDGFRCDVADMVPHDFWNKLHYQLNEIKPVFMLAEADNPKLFDAGFHMDYNWEFHHLMNDVAKRMKTPMEISQHFVNQSEIYPNRAIRMNFTSNHDENSWNGTAKARLGEALPVMTALTVAAPGMPLVYSGQEAGLDKALRFFDKDTIVWKEDPMTALYQELFAIKKANKALWNGQEGGAYVELSVSDVDRVLAFAREVEGNLVVALFNLSPEDVTFDLMANGYEGKYTDLQTKAAVKLQEVNSLTLPAWGFQLLGMNY